MWFAFFACTQSFKDSGAQYNSDTTDTATLYSATLSIRDAFSGAPIPGVALLGNFAEASSTTDETGQASTGVRSSYQIELQAEGYPPHYYMGETDRDFELIALLAEESLSAQIYSYLSLTQDPNKGVLVVALDKADLSPAVGASASINANMSQAFVLGATLPSFGTTITSNTSSVVTFPNMTPGEIEITAINANSESCLSYPSGTATQQRVDVYAGAVTVAVYTCP